MERLRGELDQLLDRLDVGLSHSRSGNNVTPVGVVAMEPKTSPTTKEFFGDLNPSLLMGQAKGAGVSVKGLLVSQVRHLIWPIFKPTLMWRVKSWAGVSSILGSGLGVGVGFVRFVQTD